MPKIFCGVFLLMAVRALGEQVPATPPRLLALAKGDPERSGFHFALLPKTLQARPDLDLNIITEVTEAGRERLPATADKPISYVAQSGGRKDMGELAGTSQTLSDDKVALLVERGLKSQHFVPVSPDQRADLVVIYHWGSHERTLVDEAERSGPNGPKGLGQSADERLYSVLRDPWRQKELVDRAALVGGTTFAVELNEVLNGRFGNPRQGLEFLQRRDAKTARLVEEAFGDCYFVTVSAFDYASVAAKRPVLLWRTKMSVNLIGVSFKETISPMVIAGKDFFGRETEGGILIRRSISRGDQVQIGEAEVKEFLDSGRYIPPAHKETEK